MKKYCIRMLSVAVLVALTVSVDIAQAKGRKKSHSAKAPSKEDLFKTLDKDHDGSVTPKEFKAGKKDAEATEAEKTLKLWDSDKDGKLTLKEYKAGLTAAEPNGKVVQKPQKPKMN